MSTTLNVDYRRSELNDLERLLHEFNINQPYFICSIRPLPRNLLEATKQTDEENAPCMQAITLERPHNCENRFILILEHSCRNAKIYRLLHRLDYTAKH